MNASDILRKAADTIDQRASERDAESERSMKSTVQSFNAEWGTDLSEEQGWSFMQHLKSSRSKQGEFQPDDFIDKVAYSALQAECAIQSDKEIKNEEFGCTEESNIAEGSEWFHRITDTVITVESVDKDFAHVKKGSLKRVFKLRKSVLVNDFQKKEPEDNVPMPSLWFNCSNSQLYKVFFKDVKHVRLTSLDTDSVKQETIKSLLANYSRRY